MGLSDQTNLTNLSGDKKAWPVYITIGNLLSARPNSPGSMAFLLLALFPVPPKLSKFFKADQRESKINADTLQDVFQLIFAPLKDVAHVGILIDSCRWQGSTWLPNSLWVDRGPYRKHGTSRVESKRLS